MNAVREGAAPRFHDPAAVLPTHRVRPPRVVLLFRERAQPGRVLAGRGQRCAVHLLFEEGKPLAGRSRKLGPCGDLQHGGVLVPAAVALPAVADRLDDPRQAASPDEAQPCGRGREVQEPAVFGHVRGAFELHAPGPSRG